MSTAGRVVIVLVATFVTTELIFRLSHFHYGISSVFSEPFDLVNFTVKCVWWFGAWFFYWWAIGKLNRRRAETRHDHGLL